MAILAEVERRVLGHLASQRRGKSALNNPDLTFVIYHSAHQHGPDEPEFTTSMDPRTGDFAWHNFLMDIKKRNPKINNVFPEIGSFFNVLAIADPNMCMAWAKTSGLTAPTMSSGAQIACGGDRRNGPSALSNAFRSATSSARSLGIRS